MKDCENKMLYNGQRVVYTDAKTSGVSIGKITGFTAKLVTVKTIHGWTSNKMSRNLYGI